MPIIDSGPIIVRFPSSRRTISEQEIKEKTEKLVERQNTVHALLNKNVDDPFFSSETFYAFYDIYLERQEEAIDMLEAIMQHYEEIQT